MPDNPAFSETPALVYNNILYRTGVLLSMSKKNRNRQSGLPFIVSAVAAILYTVLVRMVDVQPIGPQNSEVGFARLNGWVFAKAGSHTLFYWLSEVLVIAAILLAFLFALKGLVQMLRRRSIARVDSRILLLGVMFVLVIATYFLFEKVIINYRPVLEDGVLEASFPSSHTMVTMTIFGCVRAFFKTEPGDNGLMQVLLLAGTILAPLFRLLSGMHWVTDIIGGCLYSVMFIALYRTFLKTPKTGGQSR